MFQPIVLTSKFTSTLILQLPQISRALSVAPNSRLVSVCTQKLNFSTRTATALGIVPTLPPLHRRHLHNMANGMADSTTQPPTKTKLVFQLPEHQLTEVHNTELTARHAYTSLSESDRSLLKLTPEQDASNISVLIFASTIFHPQGGGQPSDIGFISSSTGDDSNKSKIFEILHVRQSITNPGVVLHFGHSVNHAGSSDVTLSLNTGMTYTQHIDLDKRTLFSRYHTAGHVLGAATRTLLEDKIEGFDELKANHFPDAASCEFKGLIDGKWKGDIQIAVDELVKKDAEVRVEWWTKQDFRDKSLERLLPGDDVWRELGEYVNKVGKPVSNGESDTRIRMVNIVGAEVYPCGGTHVPTTKGCGKVGVRKISRQKGMSRVSYNVD